ncbi:hypothetical protein [Mycobacterium sp.]|uniref:hypothetical protein n=1 Tax=Mycobacterium sp. TaxID=1785 RepID=UPI003D6AF1FC
MAFFASWPLTRLIVQHLTGGVEPDRFNSSARSSAGITVSFMALDRALAASVLTCGLIAVPIIPVGTASAFCDAADCVPNVARNVVPGAPCDPQHFYVFGLDSGSKTLVCTTAGVWAPAGPLVGLREVALPCDSLNDSAQEGDGAPLKCAQVNRTLRWVHRDDTPG